MNRPRVKPYSQEFGFKSIFYFCPLPLRLDSYSGCSVGCLYCWSQWCGHKKRYIQDGVRPINAAKLKARLEFALDSKKRHKGVINQLLEHRCPIHFGGLSDPLQAIDRRHQATYKSLEILRGFGYPVLLSTKGPLLGDPKYLELLSSYEGCALQVSFSTLDDSLAKRLEPGSPPPSERLQMIKEASKRGLWIAIRIQPFLFPVQKVEDYDLRVFASAGAKHIIVEHLRIPTNFDKKALRELNSALGIDVLECYRGFGMQISRVNYELCSEIKIPNILRFRELARQAGMTFGCGDNDLHHYSDDDCCCGTKNIQGFENIYKGNFLTAVFSRTFSGEIGLETVLKSWHPDRSIRKFLNSDCRIYHCSKPLDYLVHKWNNPGASNSLTGFYGIECSQTSLGFSYKLNRKCLKELC